jgi:hypothetical protein
VLKFTDHNSISLKLKLFKGNKGNGYWKLNTSILENQQYCKSIEKIIWTGLSNFFDWYIFLFLFLIKYHYNLLLVLSDLYYTHW